MATVLAPCWTCPAGEDICRCPLRSPVVPEPTPVDLDALTETAREVVAAR